MWSGHMSSWHNGGGTKNMLLLIIKKDVCAHRFEDRGLAIGANEMCFVCWSAPSTKGMHNARMSRSIARRNEADTNFTYAATVEMYGSQHAQFL